MLPSSINQFTIFFLDLGTFVIIYVKKPKLGQMVAQIQINCTELLLLLTFLPWKVNKS